MDETDDDGRTLGIIGLVIAFVFFPVAIFICIEALFRTDGSRGANWPAIAGIVVSVVIPVLFGLYMLQLGGCWRECD